MTDFVIIFQMIFLCCLSNVIWAIYLFYILCTFITDQVFISKIRMALPYWMGSMLVFHFNVSMFQVSREGEKKKQVKELILSVQTSFFADFWLDGGVDYFSFISILIWRFTLDFFHKPIHDPSFGSVTFSMPSREGVKKNK